MRRLEMRGGYGRMGVASWESGMTGVGSKATTRLRLLLLSAKRVASSVNVRGDSGMSRGGGRGRDWGLRTRSYRCEGAIMCCKDCERVCGQKKEVVEDGGEKERKRWRAQAVRFGGQAGVGVVKWTFVLFRNSVFGERVAESSWRLLYEYDATISQHHRLFRPRGRSILTSPSHEMANPVCITTQSYCTMTKIALLSIE